MFPRTSQWLGPLIDFARAGYLQPIWSPLITSEVGRVYTWIWLKRNGGQLSDAARGKCSQDSKRLFGLCTEVFRVVDDCPPPEPLWTDSPTDEWDIPIWTAAKRARAQFIVTSNVKDGPPKGPNGLQQFEGIYFLDPDRFLDFLEFYVDRMISSDIPELVELGEPPAAESAEPASLADRERAQRSAAVAASIDEFLADVVTRRYPDC